MFDIARAVGMALVDVPKRSARVWGSDLANPAQQRISAMGECSPLPGLCPIGGKQ